MTNPKITKRALATSIVSLLMCVAMLIGTTFAWFTDTASTAVNKVQAGTLNIDIIDATTDASKVDTGLVFQSSDGVTEGENVFWEPGATYRTEGFRIANKGNLALMYRLMVNGVTGDPALLGAIEFKMVTEDGTEVNLDEECRLAPEGVSEVLYIEGKMTETAGNECQGKSLTGLGVTVVAKQAMAEKDSIDDTYDRDAEYDAIVTEPAVPSFSVCTATQLQSVLTNNHGTATEMVLNIDSNIELAAGEVWTPFALASYAGVSKLTINGNGNYISGLNDALLGHCYFGDVEVEIKDLTLKNMTIEKDDSDFNAENRLGYGAFGYSFDNCKKVVFTNCHIENVTITDTTSDEKKVTGVGGFIGYTSSADVQFINCSATNCNVSAAYSSVGAIIGHASAGAANKTTITNGKVVDCQLKGENTAKSGYVIGTANDGTTIITTKDCANNKVYGVENSTAIYGRFVKSGTGVLIVNEVNQ